MVPSNKHLECLINAMHEIGISHKSNLLNLVSRAIVQAREQEREEIARELHDNINQLIMASKLMIDTARKEERHRQAALLKKSAATLEEVISEIRRLSGSITTPDTKDFCLLETIDQLISTISSCKNMRIVLKYDRMIEGLLDPEQKKQVYRIIQEQFNNIIKHAGASKAVLLIEYRKDTVRIKIKDNGVGFDLTQKRNGIGLVNIGKRVALLKGDLNILSAINQGSTLDVRFRINAA